MSTKTQTDYLIVGQGLAGTVLALTALKRGQKVVRVDTGEPLASYAAAGILNPVTGPRLNLSWRVAELMPFAERFYCLWEETLGCRFFEHRAIRRLFGSEKERTYHEKRFTDPQVHHFLGPLTHSALPPFNTLGECHIRGGVLDIPVFLKAASAWLERRSPLRHETFCHNDLHPTPEGVDWRGEHFGHILFCEGALVKDNPWFGHLPFKPAKGESLEVELTHPLAPEILNARKWLLPLGGTRARTGSTYAWENVFSGPTTQARTSLLTALSELIPDNPVVRFTNHRAGVRPCSHDRRPYIGRHPQYPRLALLNGLGSKGTLMAPGCAAELLDHLEHATPLHPEMNVERCFR